MQNRLMFVIVLALLVSCKRRPDRQLSAQSKKDSLSLNKRVMDSSSILQTPVDTLKQKQEIEEIDDKLQVSSAAEYIGHDNLSKPACQLDSNGFIEGIGITLKNKCDEVCQTYLVDNKTGKKIELPADFDSGLIGLKVSSNCTYFVTYSSYDMPYYDKYYTHRALITLYQINKAVGIKAIKQQATYGLKQWSIKEMKWIGEKSIALKLYKDAYSDKVRFRYFKLAL